MSLLAEVLFSVEHKKNYSREVQLLRVFHRTVLINSGERVTLDLNLRSVRKPFFDDNGLCYLGVSNSYT